MTPQLISKIWILRILELICNLDTEFQGKNPLFLNKHAEMAFFILFYEKNAVLAFFGIFYSPIQFYQSISVSVPNFKNIIKLTGLIIL